MRKDMKPEANVLVYDTVYIVKDDKFCVHSVPNISAHYTVCLLVRK